MKALDRIPVHLIYHIEIGVRETMMGTGHFFLGTLCSAWERRLVGPHPCPLFYNTLQPACCSAICDRLREACCLRTLRINLSNHSIRDRAQAPRMLHSSVLWWGDAPKASVAPKAILTYVVYGVV